MRKKLLSIVIPVYNEEEVIPELVRRLASFMDNYSKYKFEVIVVENGSIDTSFLLLQKQAKRDPRFKILQLSRNFSADGGISAGAHFVKGNALVIMMADLQEPLEMIGKFIKKWEEGYDIVYGIVKKRTGSFLRNFCSVVFYKIVNKLTNSMCPENVSDFRLVDRKVYQILNTMDERNKFVRGLIAWMGFKQTGIPFNRSKRFAGKSKANFLNVLNIALNGILSFSYLPLRLVSFLGLTITVLSFSMIVIYFILFLTYGRIVPGITTIILVMLFMFGLLFFVLGIISEYLIRIYDEVKKRPNFIIKDKINFD